MVDVRVVRPGQDAQYEYHRHALERFEEKREARVFRFRTTAVHCGRLVVARSVSGTIYWRPCRVPISGAFGASGTADRLGRRSGRRRFPGGRRTTGVRRNANTSNDRRNASHRVVPLGRKRYLTCPSSRARPQCCHGTDIGRRETGRAARTRCGRPRDGPGIVVRRALVKRPFFHRRETRAGRVGDTFK